MDTVTADPLARFEANRDRLQGLAYRMLGEKGEAEDTVQDAYLRWREHSATVDDPEAWLTTVVANLCLKRLTSARARRERYTGPWLPEPLLGHAPGPDETAEQRDSLTLGMMLVLERLNPPERLAFVLREAFGYAHREIAGIIGIDETHARQLYHRARTRVTTERARFSPGRDDNRRIVERFLAAARLGDLAGLEKLLTEDVTAWFDGGGAIGTGRPPITGRGTVARDTIHWLTASWLATADYTIGTANGRPAILVSIDGHLRCVIVPDIDATGTIAALHTVANPAKLAKVRPRS